MLAMQWERWNDQSHNKRMQQISTEGVQDDPLGNVQEI